MNPNIKSDHKKIIAYLLHRQSVIPGLRLIGIFFNDDNTLKSIELHMNHELIITHLNPDDKTKYHFIYQNFNWLALPYDDESFLDPKNKDVHTQIEYIRHRHSRNQLKFNEEHKKDAYHFRNVCEGLMNLIKKSQRIIKFYPQKPIKETREKVYTLLCVHKYGMKRFRRKTKTLKLFCALPKEIVAEICELIFEDLYIK